MGKALFWDFDGTLVHPNESFLDALYGALKAYKYDIAVEDVRDFLRKTSSWYMPEISYVEKTGQGWWDCLFERFNLFYEKHKIAKEDMQKLNLAFKDQVSDFNTYTLYDDAKPVLQQCREMGYMNYILSNNYPELPLVVKDFNISEYFEEIFVSSNIGYEKPRAELFQYALRTASFPEHCYMIGDNPVADIQGGKAAGMKTILVHRGGTSDADFTCKSLSEIPALLK